MCLTTKQRWPKIAWKPIQVFVFGWKKIDYDGKCLKSDYWLTCSQTNISPVTPKEQKEFDDFCKSQGKLWNKEILQWEDYKWNPKPNEQYWYVASWGEVMHRYHIDSNIDQDLLQLGNAFPTKEKAEKVATKITQFFKPL